MVNAFDRTFIGAAGALLLGAFVVRTVAQSPHAAAGGASPSASTLTLDTGTAITGKPGAAPTGTPKAASDNAKPTAPAKSASVTAPTSASAPKTSAAPTSANGTDAANGDDTPIKTPVDGADPATPPTTGTATPGKPLVQRDGDIIIRASGGIYDQGQDVARVTKDVRVTQEGEDFLLLCQLLTYDRGLNRAIATQDVHISGRDTTITGDRLDGDFNSKVVVLTGNVAVDSRGKGDGLKSERAPVSRSKPSHMTCDRIEYNYDTRDAVITGHIHLSQEGSSGTCDKILFDEENNIVTLQGHAHFTNAQGQAFDGPVIKIWLDSGVARAERLTITVAQTPSPHATKAPVEDVPQLPEEWKRDFEQAPLPSRMPTAEGSPAPTAGTAAPTTPAAASPAPAATSAK